MSAYLDTFNECYNDLYKRSKTFGFSPTEHRNNALFIDVFDSYLHYLNHSDSEKFCEIRNALIKERGDVFSSDRECVAFIETLCIEWNGFADIIGAEY